MNIQKSRLAALLSAMLIVCMMTAMLVVPASAAEVEETFVAYSVLTKDIIYTTLKENDFPLKAASYADMVTEMMQASGIADDKTNSVYVGQNTGIVATNANVGQWYFAAYSERYFPPVLFEEYSEELDINIKYYSVGNFNLSGYEPAGSDDITATIEVPDPPSGISAVVTKEMLSGVLDEIVALLPVVIPVMIGFIGLRKGISFLQSVLHSA